MCCIFLEAVKYTIIVQTGTGPSHGKGLIRDGPGTDCNVKIKIHGKYRSNEKSGSISIKLKKSQNFNKFEKGQ